MAGRIVQTFPLPNIFQSDASLALASKRTFPYLCYPRSIWLTERGILGKSGAEHLNMASKIMYEQPEIQKSTQTFGIY